MASPEFPEMIPMIRPNQCFAALVFPLMLLTVGCDEDDTGESPTIENLVLPAEGLVVGMQATLSGSVDFSDPDGDVDQIELTLTPPTVASVTTAADVIGADGQTTGQTAIALAVLPPEAGEYALSVIILDAEGNESNSLETTFTVAAQ
jgi:hypothetical protein